MKRTIIFLLIAASVGVTLYINKTTKRLPADAKQIAEELLLKDALFPARPVWWEDDKILAVGTVPGELSGDVVAQKACDLMEGRSLPVTGLRVEVYDVLKIQAEDDWTLMGFAHCK